MFMHHFFQLEFIGVDGKIKQGIETETAKKQAASEPHRAVFKQAFDKLGSRDADTVPLPLLILAALSLLLIAAGGAGLVTRRVRSRKVPG